MKRSGYSLSILTLLFIFRFSFSTAQIPELVLPLGHSDKLRDASFSSDGKRVATVSYDRSVKVWNTENGRLLLTLAGFNNFEVLSTVSFSPDGKTILTKNEVGKIQIWDANSGKLLLVPDFDPGSFQKNLSSAIYSPDSKYLLNLMDSTIRIYDIRAGKIFKTIKGESCGIISFSINPDKSCFLVNYANKSAQIKDFKNFETLITLTGKAFNTDFSTACFTPDGIHIITRSENKLSIWDYKNVKPVFSATEVLGPVPQLSSDSKKLLLVANLYLQNKKWKKSSEISRSFEYDSTEIWGPVPALYNFSDGRILQVYCDSTTIDRENGIIGNGMPFYCIAISPDNNNILTISDKCRIWDKSTGKILFTIDCSFDDRTSVHYTSDSKRILIITGESCNLYNALNGTLITKYEAPRFRMTSYDDDFRNFVPAFSFSPDMNKFYIVSENSYSLKLWNSTNGKELVDLKGNTKPVSESIFSNGGNFILAKSSNNYPNVKIWDIINGKLLQSLEGPEWGTASFNDDASIIITHQLASSGFETISTWDSKDARKLNNIELKTRGIKKLLLSPDNNTLTIIDTNYTAGIYNSATGVLLHNLKGTSSDVVYSRDGKGIVTTSWFDFASLWNAETGLLMDTLGGRHKRGQCDSIALTYYGDTEAVNIVVTSDIPYEKLSELQKNFVTNKVRKASFSSDSHTLLTETLADNGNPYTVVWDYETMTTPGSFWGENGSVSNDRSRLLTFEYDIPCLWDIPGNKLICKLIGEQYVEPLSGSISPDGKRILIVSDWDSVSLFSTTDGKLQNTIRFSGRFYNVDWNNQKLLVHDNSKLVVFDLATGNEICSFIGIDSADYLILTPDKFYMGSKNASARLSWLVGDQLYSFDQFDLQYNRPDIVLQRLGNKDTSLINTYRAAYKKRLKKSGFSEEMFSQEWHTPELKIINKDSLSVDYNKRQLNLNISGTDSKYKLDRLNISVNGVPLYGQNGLSVADKRTDSLSKVITVLLSEGNNSIKVSCMNEKGVESLKESFDIVYYPQIPRKPDLYLIVMSVSDYKESNYNLKYAAKDGRDFVNMFIQAANGRGEFGRVFVDTLFDKKATTKNFINLRKRLQSSHIDDQVVLFVSGHGLLDKNLDFYFATYDVDFSNPSKNGISFDKLESIMDGIPARKKLFMMDACHSGELDKDELNNAVPLNSTNNTDVTFRGSIIESGFRQNSKASGSAISLTNSFELMQELFTGLDQGTGTTVISAAAGKGYALESPLWNNGVFTCSVLNGLKNMAADKNRDGTVSISELKDYVIREVQYLTGGRQKPTARRETINFDWIIW